MTTNTYSQITHSRIGQWFEELQTVSNFISTINEIYPNILECCSDSKFQLQEVLLEINTIAHMIDEENLFKFSALDQFIFDCEKEIESLYPVYTYHNGLQTILDAH